MREFLTCLTLDFGAAICVAIALLRVFLCCNFCCNSLVCMFVPLLVGFWVICPGIVLGLMGQSIMDKFLYAGRVSEESNDGGSWSPDVGSRFDHDEEELQRGDLSPPPETATDAGSSDLQHSPLPQGSEGSDCIVTGVTPSPSAEAVLPNC